MTSNIIKHIKIPILAITLLFIIYNSSFSLFSYRRELYTQGATSGEIAYSSAILGGFKGVIADILWLRLTDLQSDHKLLELMELSELVTQLEPHIAEVWTFHAWNLSYNISLLATNKEDKWNWVKKGIELLRDQGLEINPGNSTIALELAWIFQHKIGTEGADKNGDYFRTQWVKDISSYLGENGSIPEKNSITATELEQAFKLNPLKMEQIEAVFGKLDWRSPHAYALYWGWIAKESENKEAALRSTRMIYSSAVKLALDSGLIVGNPIEQNWIYSARPNLSMIPRVHKYIYDCMYDFDVPGIKHIFASLTWVGCNALLKQNDNTQAQLLYNRFCSTFSDYNFPTMDVFISSKNELEAFGYAIDEKLIQLNPKQ